MPDVYPFAATVAAVAARLRVAGIPVTPADRWGPAPTAFGVLLVLFPDCGPDLGAVSAALPGCSASADLGFVWLAPDWLASL